MRLITAIVAKNEADRYLARVIDRCTEFSDAVLLLDDGSTDDTIKVAQGHGAASAEWKGHALWGTEAPVRRALWEWGAEVAKDGWLLICDADQVLMGDPRAYCDSWLVNTWSFPLYDCWNSETTFRADTYWQGFRYPRPWLFRPSLVPDGWQPEWNARGMHSGHAPSNWPMLNGIAHDLYWLHLGWMKPEDRAIKYERYRGQWEQLTEFERQHVQSIVEE